MASPWISLFLLSLTLYQCTGRSISIDTISVRVTNKLASSTIDVVCNEEGEIIVNPKSSHDWIVWDSSSKLYCDAVWTGTNRFAGFAAYSRRFAGQNIVFWDAREDGFYVSRDGKTGWKKGADWETEIVN